MSTTTPNPSSNDPQAFFSRGLELLDEGNWKDAVEEFTEAIRLRPDVAIGWRFRSYAFADGGNITRAIADLDEAIRLKSDDIQAYFDRGQHLLHQKLYDQALLDCNKGLALDPARADFLGLRGRIHSARGASESAEQDLTQAIEMDPEGAVNYYSWRGDLYMELTEEEKAIEDYSESLLRNPENAYVLGQRGHAYWLLTEHDLALEDFNNAVEIDPDWFWIRTRRGALHQERREYDQALEDFNEAIRLNPEYAIAYEYRSETCQKLGKHDQALLDLNEALKLQPTGPQAQRIHNRRATIHYFNKEYTKAIRDHMEALKKEPNHAATFNYLAWIWCTAPDPNVRNGRRALECATRACELTEWESPAFVDTLAAAYAEMGQFQEAIKWADKAAELAVNDQARTEYQLRRQQFENREPLRVTPRVED
jgi:tetratricopeptide (TPR) repeat protein